MQTIRVSGDVDQNHRLVATLPNSVAPGKVDVLVMVPSSKEDEASNEWFEGIAREWHDELADPRQDIYSLNDGLPANGSR
jgi:hypothetical protein